MQRWRGDGRCDGLGHSELRSQTRTDSRKLMGPKNAHGNSRPRYEHAIFEVAKLVKQHGKRLRKEGRSDEPPGPTMAEEIAQLKKEAKKNEADLEVARLNARRAGDSKRQLKSRLIAKRSAVSKARKEERDAAAAKVKAAKALRDKQLHKKIDATVERLVDRRVAREQLSNEQRIAELIKQRARARERARSKEEDAKLSQKRLHRAQAAERELRELKRARQEDAPELKSESDESEPEPPEQQILKRPRRDELGRWQAESDELRALKWAQLARGVAPSTVSANIQDVLAILAPDANAPASCERQNKIMRGEVTLAGEAMAAFKFAKATRVICAAWDESTSFGDAVISCNFQVEYADGTREDLCLRGLSILPEGGTSQAVLKHIEARIINYSRTILTKWMEAHEKQHGVGSWVAAGGPSPANIGLHRLCEDTVLMTDTCNGARCTKRLLANAIVQAIAEKVGKEAWEAMSEEERNKKYCTYRGDCYQHLRNIIIDAMASKGNELIKEALEDDLAEFSSYERIDPDGSNVIRAAFKEFHHGGEYAKGRGREFDAWRKKQHPAALFIPFERALGSRQDLAVDGCVAIYKNRMMMLEFLRGYLDCPKSQNVLDKSLYTLLRCNEFVALLRVNTLWHYLFSDPFRWLSGKTSKLASWSLFKMGWVLELVEKAMEKIEENPKLLLDPTLDIFKPVADEQPEFAAWREEQLERRVVAEDGTKHYLVREMLREARTPAAGSGNEQATARTLELAKAQATRALEKLHDKRLALADKLSSQDGENAYSRNADAHARTLGAHGTNDPVENKFASADYVRRTYRGVSVHNTSGIVQQRTAHDFDRPLNVASDRRKRKADLEEPQEMGFFWRLAAPLRGSLVAMARHELAASLKQGRLDKLSHDEEKLLRREEAVQRQLNATVDRYAAALELFDQWVAQGVKDRRELDAALKGKSQNEQLAELRRQIEMRTLGCGWTQFATKFTFSADEKEHTTEQLRGVLLDDILPHEMTLRRKQKLPKAAAPPQTKVRVMKALGSDDADALRLESKSLFNTDNLLEKAEAARLLREAAGISDSVEAVQPKEAPAFDTNLIGKRLEVCWPYKKDGETIKIWASGTVKRVADGLTNTRSPKAKKILPAGALLWAWDADNDYDEEAGEKWLVLQPERWNKQVQYAWRFDPCELVPQGAPRPPPRRPLVEHGDDD